MANPSKAKGNRFEVQLVESAKGEGFDKTKRAWGSNGRALGWTEEVDVLIGKTGSLEEFPVQAKVRKRLPAYLQIPEGTEAVAFKQDRGDTMVLISWEGYIEWCKLRSCSSPTPSPSEE